MHPPKTIVSDAGDRLDGLRILHVLDHSVPIHSGYSFRSLAIFREQRKRGWHTIHLTTPKHTEPGELRELSEGLDFYRTPARTGTLSRLPIAGELALVDSVAQNIDKVAALEDPDILHAHSPALNALAALRASRRLDLPVVYEVRGFWEDAAVSHGTSSPGGLRYRMTRTLETFALRNCDAVVTICEGLRQDMLARGISPERIFVVPNGVDVAKFPFRPQRDTQLARQLGLEGKTVIGFLGSYYSYEGLDLLISSLPRVLENNPAIAVLLVGGGPEEEALKRQVDAAGLAGAVHFVGRVPHDQVERYYALVDIFVYPRHKMRLTDTVTPLKPLEAMALGGIVLASDVGGHRELVRDKETGVLFEADNRTALADLVLRLTGDRSGWDAMCSAARQFVERERNWAATTDPYREAYAKAIIQWKRRTRRAAVTSSVKLGSKSGANA